MAANSSTATRWRPRSVRRKPCGVRPPGRRRSSGPIDAPLASGAARRRRHVGVARAADAAHGLAELRLERQPPGVDVQVVAGAAHRRVVGARRRPLATRVEVGTVGSDRLAHRRDALVGDEVGQGRAGAGLAEELEALHPARLAELLQAALGGGVGLAGAEAPVDLGGEREAQLGQPAEQLEVDRVGCDGAPLGLARPGHAGGLVDGHELGVAGRGLAGRRRLAPALPAGRSGPHPAGRVSGVARDGRRERLCVRAAASERSSSRSSAKSSRSRSPVGSERWVARPGGGPRRSAATTASGRDQRAGPLAWSSVAVPVGLAEGLELAPATLVLAAVMPGDALGVDGDRGRLGDERRLAAFGRDPAGQGVVLGQMQAHVGAAEHRAARGRRFGPGRSRRPS